ncbi:MAG: NFACT family protein, partial [Atribacterota bacterium]|nr:NFACT family protein [Atribacterota bacterium]
MKLDSITLSSVLSEIKNNYLPSKIVEVKQISKYEISFALKNKQILRNLFISIRPDRMAFFIKESFFSEDNFPSLFLKQLKSWIEGGMLTDAQHYDFDRFIKLSIEPYNRFGKIKKYQLLIEFMGKHSNIVLIDDEEIIKAPLKQV